MPAGSMNSARLVVARWECKHIAARTDRFGVVAEDECGSYVRTDAEGRWTALGEAGAYWRQTVDGHVVRRGKRGFVACGGSERAQVDVRARDVLERFARAVRECPDEMRQREGDRAELVRRLAVGAGWTPERLAEQRTRFRLAYPERAEILPPHRYRDLVLLPATGCPNGKCSFCAFYRDRRFRIFGESEFESHLSAVRAAFGGALAARTGVFLGSASALSIPNAVLLPRLHRVREFVGTLRRGIAAFLDPDRSPPRRDHDWRDLREAGLEETCVGLETGLPALRAAAGKSADLARVVRSIERQKEAGLRVAIVVLVGLGSETQERAHQEATVDLIEGLPLDATDTVYLSPLVAGAARSASPEGLAAWRRITEAATSARTAMYLIERYAWLA